MGSNSKIEWTDHTWNPVTGCSKISPGCAHCYAERMSKRLAGRCGYPADEPFAVTMHPERLEEPLHWKKPRMIFVCSMGDLFHKDVPDEWILQVFNTMRACEALELGHTFQILTKRPERMRDICQRLRWDGRGLGRLWIAHSADDPGYRLMGGKGCTGLQRVWLGVTAEDQQRADERIPLLLQTPAAVRFVSVEPMLGPVRLMDHYYSYLEGWELVADHDAGCPGGGPYCEIHCPVPVQERTAKIDWVICGGETGPGARPMHPEWVRSLHDQCKAAEVPFFFNSWGDWFPRDQWEHNPELVLPDDDVAYHDSPTTHVFHDGNDWYPVHRVGKKAAGALLDGRAWREMPERGAAS
jgi:protein gp37